MCNRTKRHSIMLMVTMLSLSTMLSPITSVRAEEPQATEITTIKQEVLPIEVPKDITGEEGQKLQELTLPEQWSWVDQEIALTTATTEYLARLQVDDQAYDYSTTTGYNAEGHYVELLVPVIVNEKKIEAPTPIQETKPEVITNSDGMMAIETTPNVIQPLSEPEPQKATNLQSNVNDENVVEINETTFPDPVFRDYVSSRFDVNPKDNKLTESDIERITVINVSNKDVSNLKGIEHFANLQSLSCNNTKLSELNVSENKLLKRIVCSNNAQLTSLIISGADALEELTCCETGIINLDASENKSLRKLFAFKNPKLTSLTVLGADALESLICYETNLLNLNIGNNTKLHLNHDVESNANINAYGTSINMLEVSKDFDPKKVSHLENASLNEFDGILTIIDPNKPVTYQYDSGIFRLGSASMNITLIITYYSDITIANKMYYTGQPIVPEVEVIGSTKTPTIRYQVRNGENWIDYVGIPINIGNYRAIVEVLGEGIYQTTETPIEFSILKANNELSGFIFNDITYGEELSIPKVDAKSGTVSLTYSDAIDGTYTKNLPTQAGTYYVKASVPGSENYLEHEEITSFTIHKAKPAYDTPKDISVVYGNKLSNVSLPNGFQWKDETLPVGDVGTQEHHVTFIPTDTNNYETINDIKVNVNVTKAANSLIEALSIKDWTYGEQANEPDAGAMFGDVVFTYSDAKDGEYTVTKPSNAGTYFVKASIPGTDNYLTYEEIKAFTIHKAKPDIPKDISAVYGNKLSDISLPNGFQWKDETLPVGDVGTQEHHVTFSPTDTNNYETINDIKVYVNVTKATNSLIEALSIKDWTYGEQANEPDAGAMFGDVAFTYSDAKDGEYTVTKPNNAGAYYVKASVKDTNNYTGLEEIVSFKILPRNAKHVSVSEINSEEDIKNLIVNDGETILELGTDYEVERKQNKQEVIVTITFKGNYTGVITKSYTVKEEPDQPIIDEPTNEHHDILTGSTLIQDGKDGLWEFAGNYQELVGISLDGKAFRIEPINKTSANLYMNGYTDIAGMVEEGSVKITLYQDFLKTLSNDSHALEVKLETNGDSSYGETSFEINIKDEPIVEPDEPKDEPKDEPQDKPKEEPEKEQPKQEVIKPKETKEEKKPQVQSKENKGVPTGDQTQSASLVLLGLISLASMIFLSKKKRNT